MDSQMYMLLGQLTAEVKALREQHEGWRKENEKDSGILSSKIDRIEGTLDDLARWKPGVDATIQRIAVEQNKLAAVVGKGMAAFALIGTVVALVSAGMWQLIIHWGDLANGWRAFTGGK